MDFSLDSAVDFLMDPVSGLPVVDLDRMFDRVNAAHFDSFLIYPIMRWNRRLRSSAGRFIPGRRHRWDSFPPAIELASYLLEEENFLALIEDTLSHEMIHLWLWQRGKSYGHTPEFWVKMKAMGVSRYNPVPRTRPYKYVYRCSACAKEFHARRRLGVLACAKCCNAHTGGRYDARFKLVLDSVATSILREGAQGARERV